MSDLSNSNIRPVENLNFGYFDSDFERLPERIDPEEARRIVNSDRYVVKQAFHEYRSVLGATNDPDEAVKASAYLLETDEQINLFLNVVFAAELCGQNTLRFFAGKQ